MTEGYYAPHLSMKTTTINQKRESYERYELLETPG